MDVFKVNSLLPDLNIGYCQPLEISLMPPSNE